MTYTWHFNTGGREVDPIPNRCHRGPMIPIEEVLAAPFVVMGDFEIFRSAVLARLVGTTQPAVQTRELLLRVINSSLISLFPELDTQREALKVLICEKRRSVDIESDLADITPFLNRTVALMPRTNQIEYAFDRIQDFMESNSPVSRVAGKCAIILYAAYRESGIENVFG